MIYFGFVVWFCCLVWFGLIGWGCAGVSWAHAHYTGDLGRYAIDGNVECVGRVDTQVKIRGFRIELGEIDSLLAKHPLVRATISVARADGPGGEKQIVSYIVSDEAVTKSSGPGLSSTLKAYIRAALPVYMVPSVIVFLSKIPLTPNGKIDRANLPAPPGPPLPEDTDECTETESLIIDVWRRVVKATIRRHGLFVDAGLNSLNAVRVVIALRQELSLPTLPIDSLTVWSSPHLLGTAIDNTVWLNVDAAPPAGAADDVLRHVMGDVSQHLARIRYGV